jgi:glycosyl transferase family 25
MNTYVINLRQSEQRRRHVGGQLEALGMDHTFVEAVDGRQLSQVDRARLVDEDVVAKYPQWLTPGQIGCALSHLRVYEQILIAGDEVALVVEDDVVLPPSMPRIAGKVAPQMRGSEVVLLYYRSFSACRLSSARGVEIEPGTRLLYPLDPNQLNTTAAYLINRKACRGLANWILPVRAGADSWGEFYGQGAIESLRVVTPRLVSVRKDFRSTIGYVGQRSARARLFGAVERHRIFPLFQLMTLNRHLIERRMSKVVIVSEASPILHASADGGI